MVVNMEDKVEVLMGDTAQITCMFESSEGIGGRIIQWFYVTSTGEEKQIYQQDPTMKTVVPRTPFTERMSVNSSGATNQVVLTINDVQLGDEVEFICQVQSLSEGTAKGRTNLRVFVIPDPPTIEGTETGITIDQESPSKIATCEVKNGYPRPQITWYKNNMPLPSKLERSSVTIESSRLFSVKSVLSMIVVKENKDDKFYCEVNYAAPGGETRMMESEHINISVYYPATAVKMWVESPKGKIKESDSVELHCKDNGNPSSSMVTIKHLKSNKTWEENVVLLHNVSRWNSGEYSCTSVDPETFQEVSGNLMLSVNYLDPAVVEPKGGAVVTQGDELRATCNAVSSLPTHATWLKNGVQIAKGHVLTLKNTTFSTAGTYQCVITVPEIEDMQTSGALTVKVHGKPLFDIVGPGYMKKEVNVDETVNLSCSARGSPSPTIVWTTSDGQAAPTQETGDNVHSSVQFTITADVTAFCNVSNEYGEDTVTFDIKTTPPPEGKGVIIAVIIICILLLAILGSVLYYLYKKGKICGRSAKQDLTKENSNKDNIVVEMKRDNTEEAVLLGVNGEKQPLSD
uniref:Melanoma cell adhesion molecule b n=1 Tax=Tetraodon nigroviridis TaxID=99883 RepID=H3C2I9_TETNG